MLSQKAQAAIKIEASAGVAETLTDTEVIYVQARPTITFETTLVQRPRNGALGLNKSVVTAKKATVVLVVPFAGKGSSGTPYWADMYQGCGASKSSQVYTLNGTESTYKTLTIGVNIDGHYHVVWGCMGTCVHNIPDVDSGEIPTVTFTFTGIWEQPTQAALWADATAPVHALPRGATVTLDAVVPLISNFSLDFGNTVVMRPDHTSATGFKHAHITARTPTGGIDPEATLLATYDPIDKLVDATEVDIQYVLNGGSNNTMTIDIAKAQFTGAPYGDRNGMVIHQLAFQANEDNVVITFA